MAIPNLKLLLIGGVILFGLTGGIYLVFKSVTELEEGGSDGRIYQLVKAS